MKFTEVEKLVQDIQDGNLPDLPVGRSQAIRLSDIPDYDDSEEWILPPYLPIGDSMLISGLPGSGKSSLVASMVASVTTGNTWMNTPVMQGNVLYIYLEDKLPKLKKLLKDNGVNTDRVHVLQEVTTSKPIMGFKASDLISLPNDIIALMDAVREHKPTLIVVDALSRLTNRVSRKEHEQIAAIFKAISLFCGCCVVYINHLKPGVYAVDNIVSRIENPLFHQIARISLYSAYDPITDIRGIMDIKTNNEKTVPFLYRIQKQLDGTVRVVPAYNQFMISSGRIEEDNNEIRGKILACLQSIGPSTPIDISHHTQVNHSTVKVYVGRMVKIGLLVKKEGGRYALPTVIETVLFNEESELQELQTGLQEELQPSNEGTSDSTNTVTSVTPEKKIVSKKPTGTVKRRTNESSSKQQKEDTINP